MPTIEEAHRMARERAAEQLAQKTGGPAMTCLTVRDYFAAAALQGLLANPQLKAEILKSGGCDSGWIESSAFGFADEMMKERK